MEDFITAYIECALWSSMDDSDELGGEPLDKNYGPEDIAPEALERMRADCKKFYRAHEADINASPRLSGQWINAAMAGHDFWLTRNGHGAGFDDGDWPEDVGERLSNACGWQTEFPECDLYIGDDGLIYIS
jgi:hypothetical protein